MRSPEQRAERLEYERGRNAAMTPDQKARRNAMERERRANSPEDMKARRLAANRAWRARHSLQSKSYAQIYNRRNLRFRRYGLSPDRVAAMLADQAGLCLVCGRELFLWSEVRKHADTACVDHDRRCCPRDGSCGKCVRGLLCSPCNMGLGLLGDDAGRLARAIAYLKKG